MAKTLTTMLFVIAAALAFGSWALSSPVGSTPDEDYHLASIWCGHGERAGLCELDQLDGPRLIPNNIETAKCYAQQRESSGACQNQSVVSPIAGLVETTRVNSGTQYPSGFYFWTSFLTGENLAVSTVLIRVANALLFIGLGLVTWALSPRGTRNTVALGSVICLVPLGLFFIPSVNPTSWSLISAFLLVPALAGWFQSAGWRSWALGGIAAVATLIGIGARGDSAIYSVIGCLAILTLMAQPTQAFALRALMPLALMAISAVSYFKSAQGSLALAGMSQDDLPAMPLPNLIVNNLFSLPELVLGVFGVNFHASSFTGLGWLDTPMPALVWAPSLSVVAGVLLLAFRKLDLRRTLALSGVAITLLAIPMIILTQGRVPVGWQVQPRYIMPLVIIFVLVALLPNVAEPQRPRVGLTTAQKLIIVMLLGLANSVALFTNLQRYVAPGALNLNRNIEWWWQMSIQPMTVLVIGSASFLGVVALCLFADSISRRWDRRRSAKPASVTATSAA